MRCVLSTQGYLTTYYDAQRDCTGTVGKTGTHSTGKPNCPPAEKFDNELHAIELGMTPAPPPPEPPLGTIPMP